MANENHGPTLQEAERMMASLADHYGHGWIAGRNLQGLRAQVERLPRRIEFLGGQRTSYVQLDSVLAILGDKG